MSLNVLFFRKAKKANRAVEITDTEAIIPAVKDKPELRVPLPNRRLKTIEERNESLDERANEIAKLEEEIEIQRKILLEFSKEYHETKTGAADVVVQNLEVKELMERRSALVSPSSWIETLEGVSYKDIFERKRDIRKLGNPVYQVKHRVEPIASLYVDLGKAAEKELELTETAVSKAEPASKVEPKQKTAAEKTLELLSTLLGTTGTVSPPFPCCFREQIF